MDSNLMGPLNQKGIVFLFFLIRFHIEKTEGNATSCKRCLFFCPRNRQTELQGINRRTEPRLEVCSEGIRAIVFFSIKTLFPEDPF
jgi:hypothetical protein